MNRGTPPPHRGGADHTLGHAVRDASWEIQLGPPPAAAVVVSGGGVASTVVAHWLARHGSRFTVMSVDLGQTRGVLAAAATAARLRAEHRLVDLSGYARALLRNPNPNTTTGGTTGTAGAAGTGGRMANSLAVMIELGVAAAIHRDATTVLLGVHADDSLVDRLLLRGRGAFHIQAPLVDLPIADVIRLGADLRVPWEQTRSCHHDQHAHCGACTGCRHRRGAFTAAGLPDPTTYLHPGR